MLNVNDPLKNDKKPPGSQGGFSVFGVSHQRRAGYLSTLQKGQPENVTGCY